MLQQGQSQRDMQQLLRSSEMALSVHQVILPYAKAVPALALGVREVRAILSRAADSLRFVKELHTTVTFKTHRAVLAPKTSTIKVSSINVCFDTAAARLVIKM